MNKEGKNTTTRLLPLTTLTTLTPLTTQNERIHSFRTQVQADVV